jgi:hypothetical protein
MMSEQLNKTERDITSLEKEFSPKNIFEYGQMCDRVAWELTEAVLDKKGEVTILLPSRGALPIFMGAMLALKENQDLKELQITQRIKLPPLSCFDYVRRVVEGNSPKEGDIEVLIFPFTADVNLGNRLGSEEEERQVVDDMRQFGARAVTGFLNPPGRRENFELNLFLAFLEMAERRKGTASFYQKLGQAKNLVMIDTVISGRASFTILDEFEEMGLEIGKRGNLRPILVVDRNGEQLKSQFGHFIFGYPDCRIDVPRIMSEDRGAALEGVVAVVYPDLIIEAHKQGLCPDGYPLLGSWHDVPLKVRGEYLDVFNRFLAMVDAIVAGRDFEKERADFCAALKKSGVLRVGDAVSDETEINVQGVESLVETSAHVIQADFSKEKTKSLIRKISKRLQK